MPTVSGDTSLRANTNDPKEYTLYQDDGVTPVDITGFIEVELVFVNQSTMVKTNFKYTDSGNKIQVTDATGGVILFSPAATDFIVAGVYAIYFLITDGAKTMSIPEKIEYTFTVRDDF